MRHGTHYSCERLFFIMLVLVIHGILIACANFTNQEQSFVQTRGAHVNWRSGNDFFQVWIEALYDVRENESKINALIDNILAMNSKMYVSEKKHQLKLVWAKLNAASFIRTVSTVINTIASCTPRYATSTVCTPELITTTMQRTTSVWLVWAIIAVFDIITKLTLCNAHIVTTSKLAKRTSFRGGYLRWWSGRILETIPFVWTIMAITVTVAYPSLVNTMPVVAFESWCITSIA